MALEAVLLIVLLAAALLPVVRLGRPGGLHALGAIVLAVAVGSVSWRTLQSRSTGINRLVAAVSPAEAPGDGYVSSATCRACHAEQHATWAASYHRTMTQTARPDNVLAPFDGTELDRKSVV